MTRSDGPTPETRQLEDLFSRLESEFRDPVEALDNRLAARRGLYRGPGVTDDEWRRLRVSIIDSQDETSADE